MPLGKTYTSYIGFVIVQINGQNTLKCKASKIEGAN